MDSEAYSDSQAAYDWRRKVYASLLAPEDLESHPNFGWRDYPYFELDQFGWSREGPWRLSGFIGHQSAEDELEDVCRRAARGHHEFCVETICGSQTLTCYIQDRTFDGRESWDRIVLGPYHEFKSLLERYGITPRHIEPEPATPEGKLRKYAKLGYEFQLRKLWNKHYLYARKWIKEKRKRDTKYIGQWTEQLKKTAEELNITIKAY